MSDENIRHAAAIGWLIDRLAKAEGRTLVDVAVELIIYVERIDAGLQEWERQND